MVVSPGRRLQRCQSTVEGYAMDSQLPRAHVLMRQFMTRLTVDSPDSPHENAASGR